MAGGFPWVQFLTSVLAAIALVVAIWSLKYSYDSNRIAKNSNNISEAALKHAKRASIEEHRPRLQLGSSTIKQFKGSGDRITLLVNVKMKNTGKTPAQNITYSKYCTKVMTPWEKRNVTFLPKPKIAKSLSPGQTFILVIEANLSFRDKPDMVEKVMAEWAEGRVYVLVDMCLKYTDVSSEHEYSLSGSYKLNNQESVVKDYRDE